MSIRVPWTSICYLLGLLVGLGFGGVAVLCVVVSTDYLVFAALLCVVAFVLFMSAWDRGNRL